jgi:hypothetical protein
MGKEKFPANVRPVTADVQEEEQSRFTGRTIKSKKHLRNVDCLSWRIRASYLRRAVM